MTRPSIPRIVVAMIWCDGQLLLQLRDFRAEIADPGEWGFFGGHLEPGEASENGLRRELLEELGWAPRALQPLGSFDAEEGRHIIGYCGRRPAPVDTLVLGEGQELGAFTLSELSTGSAFSRRWNRYFSLTAITRHALQLWCGPLTPGGTTR